MKLSEIKESLKSLSTLTFKLPNGGEVPAHFHVTEVGSINKHFIDCGGAIRQENVVNFQLWEDGDFDHKLGAQKLLSIIELSERKLGLKDSDIEVEYQSDTIGKYGLDFDGSNFILTTKQTACLANEFCGVPSEDKMVDLSALVSTQNSCTPGGGCC